LESDKDSDAQVTYAEFLAAQSRDLLFEFEHQDRNADGIVTAAELGRRSAAGKTRYANSSPRVLEAEHEIDSEIYVPDAVTIADVDVQVSIVKNGDDDLKVRLVGPDGTTAVLYYTSGRKAWSGGPMFRDTIIDDEAPAAPQRLPRPPAHRSFRPQSIGNANMSSLKAFYGKPAKGRWRLIVGNDARYDGGSAGLLQGWALLVKPARTHRASSAVLPTTTGTK
jgi:subtilisin-like proprotein convertase family protein